MSAQRWVIWRCPNDPSHDVGGTLEDRDAECSMCRVGTVMERVVVVPEAEVERLREERQQMLAYLYIHAPYGLAARMERRWGVAASSDHQATPDGRYNVCPTCCNITAAPVCGRCGQQLAGDPDCEGWGDTLMRGFVAAQGRGLTSPKEAER